MRQRKIALMIGVEMILPKTVTYLGLNSYRIVGVREEEGMSSLS